MQWTVLMSLILIFSCQTSNKHHTKWDYSAINKNHNWAKLDPTYSSCEKGIHQSPINISTEYVLEEKNTVSFNYDNEKAKIINNGHTIELAFDDQNTITVDKKTFTLKQLHFHTHSEHSIDGKFYPAEIHLVHQAIDGQLAVLAIFIELDESAKERFGFFRNIGKENTSINFKQLKKHFVSHYYYEGSLTTPPCSENVKWIILSKPLHLKAAQLAPFEKYYKNNYRPVNKLNDRVVFLSH